MSMDTKSFAMETPLIEVHRAAGARLAEFEGCVLPESFSNFEKDAYWPRASRTWARPNKSRGARLAGLLAAADVPPEERCRRQAVCHGAALPAARKGARTGLTANSLPISRFRLRQFAPFLVVSAQVIQDHP